MEKSSKRKPRVPSSSGIELTDERFKNLRQNPLFRKVPKRERRVEIDKRFRSMFNDESFKLKYKVDKRGRPIKTTTNENLRKYYHLTDWDDTEKPKEEGDVTKEDDASIVGDNDDHEKKKDGDETSRSTGQESEDEADAETEEHIEGDITEAEIKSKPKKEQKVKIGIKDKKKIRDMEVDYARGEKDFISDEESDSGNSSSSEEDEVENLTHSWGELDKNADTTEESTSSLALCNMDWDRVKATDLMVLFHSFLPTGGALKCITIFPSEFGKERLAEEELHGPKELRAPEGTVKLESDEEEGDDDEGEEGGGYHMEKLREYQLNRLRYYYAVLEFDSAATAEAIYRECDGMEYESSATRVDLRYIPDEMTFDETFKDRCDTVPQADKYRPRFFTTTALQQVKVDLTWDETDPLRKELTQRIYDPKENVDDEDIKAYLASSSDSEGDENPENLGEDDESGQEGKNPSKTKGGTVSKYQALLQSIEEAEKKKKDKDVGLEITWGVGLKEKTEDIVKKKLKETTIAEMTPWEQQLEKRREKRKLRKVEKKKGGVDSSSQSDSDSSENDSDNSFVDGDKPFSDDEVDVDMSDPFFKEELEKRNSKGSKKSSKDKGQKPKETSKDEDAAALELLLMDDDMDKKNHFNFKKIVDKESKSEKSKRKKRKFKQIESSSKGEDDFQVDVNDERFSAIFSSHKYNVDPSDPNFKKTKGMEAISSEKQKRRIANDQATSSSNVKDQGYGKETKVDEPEEKSSKNSEISYLVKSIKRNAQYFKNIPRKGAAFNKRR